MKEIKFLGTTLKDIKNFPASTKREAGFQLGRVEDGLDPRDWKPMNSIASGVREIRIHENGEYRVIYIAKLNDKIYVLHAFQKKTQKTEQKDLNLAIKRLKEI